MARVRLGVALLVPAPFSHELDGLRRALGSGTLGRIPPHLTLVPPVNVRSSEIRTALRVLRDAAADARPIDVRLGPPASFAPRTPTVHLAVTEPAAAVARLRRLREAVFTEPLARTLTHEFEPHVTLDDDADPGSIASTLDTLAGYTIDVTFDRVHLLQEQRADDLGRHWVPIADVPLGPRVVVGRGGVELELTTTDLIDPEARRLVDEEGSKSVREARPVFAVTARRRGSVVGVALALPDHAGAAVIVARAERGQGIAGQLRKALAHAEATR